MRAARVLPFVLALCLIASPAFPKEGFGMTKKVISLIRMNPAAVLILGTNLQVKVKASNAKSKDLALQIQSALGSELVQHDPRLVLEDKRPQTLVEVDLLQNDYSDRWETRTERTLRESGKDKDGKPIFQEAMVQVRYHLIGHRFKVAYKVTEVATKKPLFADSIEVAFREEFKEGEDARSQAELEANASRSAVAEIVTKLTPTPEEIYVLLPKGKLEDFGNFAEGGLWSRYAEALEARPPFAEPADESYRQYGMGLAYEAMSYEADDVATTLRYLERAAQHYNEAITGNPKEDYFFKAHETALVVQGWRRVENVIRREDGPVKKVTQPPLDRVQTSLAKYQTIATQQATWEGVGSSSKPPSGAKALQASAAPAAGGMTNKDVIEMVRAGVDEDLILGTITDATACAFDLTPKGLIELTKAKVGKPVIQALQEKTCS